VWRHELQCYWPRHCFLSSCCCNRPLVCRAAHPTFSLSFKTFFSLGGLSPQGFVWCKQFCIKWIHERSRLRVFWEQSVEESIWTYDMSMGWDHVSELHLPAGLWYMSMENHGGMMLAGETEEHWEKPVPMTLCPPQILHELTGAPTRTLAVRYRRLTVWATVLPRAGMGKLFCGRAKWKK
jgi:hypothetical protein